MALLELALDILGDPDFESLFIVIRRAETVGADGRSVLTSSQLQGRGVVTSASQNNLSRREDYQIGMRGISVVTTLPLFGVRVGYQPDVILWNNSKYIVEHVDNYSHFGTGWYQVECISTEQIDL